MRTRRNLGGDGRAAGSRGSSGTTGGVGVSRDGGLHCSLISVPDLQCEAESAFPKKASGPMRKGGSLADGETGQLLKNNRLEASLGYIWCQVDESSKCES